MVPAKDQHRNDTATKGRMKQSHSMAIGAGLGLALLLGSASLAAAGVTPFVATLSGAEEVPARETDARGVAVFRLSPDETELHYRLVTGDIDNVVAAHIHVAPEGANGPVVAFLAGPFDPGGGQSSGLLAEGTITSADLVGPLTGLTLADLLDEMADGNTYVNVHTNDGVAPTNTGAGDFPGGEIRGQIVHPGRP
jgi:hypothetical protein